MPNKQSLTETIKEEVLADLRKSGYPYKPGMKYSTSRGDSIYQSAPALIASMKAEIMEEIEAEQEAMENRGEIIKEGYGNYPNLAGSKRNYKLTDFERDAIKRDILDDIGVDTRRLGYQPRNLRRDLINQTIVENIKDELLNEMHATRYSQTIPKSDWRNILSDKSIDRRISQHYSNLKDLQGEVCRGLEIMRDTDKRLNKITDPETRRVVETIFLEAQKEGMPLDHIINQLNAGHGTGTRWKQQVGGWFGSGEGRGLLWGIGLSLVISLLFPATREGLRNLGVKMLQGTMNLTEQTRSTFGLAKEELEDMIAEANFNNLQDSQDSPQEPIDPIDLDKNQDDDSPS